MIRPNDAGSKAFPFCVAAFGSALQMLHLGREGTGNGQLMAECLVKSKLHSFKDGSKLLYSPEQEGNIEGIAIES